MPFVLHNTVLLTHARGPCTCALRILIQLLCASVVVQGCDTLYPCVYTCLSAVCSPACLVLHILSITACTPLVDQPSLQTDNQACGMQVYEQMHGFICYGMTEGGGFV